MSCQLSSHGFIAFIGGPNDSMALYKYTDGTAEFVAALSFRIQSMPEPGHPQDCLNRRDVRRGFMAHPELFQDVDLDKTEFYYDGNGSKC